MSASVICLLLLFSAAVNAKQQLFTYRAWKNVVDLSVPCSELAYGQAMLCLTFESNGTLNGFIGGSDWNLTVEGQCDRECLFEANGIVEGQPWKYRYWGVFVRGGGVQSVMVGGIVRVLAHGPNSPANETGSFYAVEDTSITHGGAPPPPQAQTNITIIGSVAGAFLAVLACVALVVVILRKRQKVPPPTVPSQLWPSRGPDMSNDPQLYQRAHC